MRRLLVAAVAVAVGALVVVPSAGAVSANGRGSSHDTTLAVIGDVPYGAALIAEFPSDIQEINADPDVSSVIHLGDIKNGSSRCDDSYFQARLADFQTFADPLVYTPGDNEWTDCHRASNGGYTPTERLAAVRRTFFPRFGHTLGADMAVDYQSDAFPENTTFYGSRVQYGVVHIIGSNDDQDPWFTDRKDANGNPQPETPQEKQLQVAEYTSREAAALQWIDRIFADAEAHKAAGVVLGMQADMYDPADPPSELTAFAPIKARIAQDTAAFGKPVLLMEGDSHLFKVDRPADQPSNLTRVVVQGSTNTPHEWLRLRVDPKTTQVFSCENVQFQTGTVTPCPAPLAP